MAGSGVILDTTLVQVLQCTYGPTLEVKTEESIKYITSTNTAPLDLDKSLLENFEVVEKAN